MRSVPSIATSLLLGWLLLPVTGIASEESPPILREWGFFFYCSYDNDLAEAGPAIHKEIAAGIAGTELAAAMQVDDSSKKGMRRHLFLGSQVQTSEVGSEASADHHQLLAGLRWFIEAVPCRRYGLVILNHGGGLDEMCLDEQPGEGGPRWMSGYALGAELRDYRRELRRSGRDIPLLFLQQCGRASLTNLYNFRGTSDTILASSIQVGSPNTYYRNLFKRCEQLKLTTGPRIAELIARHDKHYDSYVCVDAALLDDLPEQWLTLVPRFDASEATPIYSALDQQAFALESLLDVEKLPTAQRRYFADLVIGHWHRQRSLDKGLGLSVFLPRSADQAASFQSHPLYAGLSGSLPLIE